MPSFAYERRRLSAAVSEQTLASGSPFTGCDPISRNPGSERRYWERYGSLDATMVVDEEEAMIIGAAVRAAGEIVDE